MKNPLSMIAAVAALGIASQADARAERTAQVPNGQTISCQLCHVGANFAERTAFGQQVQDNLVGDPVMAATVDWQDIYALDADGDGATNGAEMGDPNGDWQQGDADPGLVSDPSDPADTPPGGQGGEGGEGGEGGMGGGVVGPDGGVGGGNGGTAGEGGGDDGDDGGCASSDSAPSAPLLVMLSLFGGVLLRRR